MDKKRLEILTGIDAKLTDEERKALADTMMELHAKIIASDIELRIAKDYIAALEKGEIDLSDSISGDDGPTIMSGDFVKA